MFNRLIALLLLLPLLLMGAAAESVWEDYIPDDDDIDPASLEAFDVDEIIANMSLREKVQQMMLTTPASGSKPMSWVPGGYILFASDFEGRTAEEVREMTAALRDSSELPMVIAVDEEGGSVVRVSKYKKLRSEPYESPRNVYAEGGWEGIEEDARDKANFLLDLGINLNLAPVADVALDKSNYMYSRSFSTDADEASEFIRRYITVSNEEGIGSALKHFPGYGGNSNTHSGVSMDKRSLETFEERDLLPFIAGIEAGAGCVMVSHNIVTCFDEEYPASLSKNVHDYLRNELGFEGVIMTDELGMAAVQLFTKNPAVAAIQAGNDMLCIKAATAQIDKVIAAVEAGKISEEQINASVRRILLWKQTLTD